MISAAGMASAFEAIAMAVKTGVDARTLIDTINASTGRNTATTDKIPTSVLPRTFDYGGKLATMYKDIDLCLTEAKQSKVPMWVGSAGRAALVPGFADRDQWIALGHTPATLGFIWLDSISEIVELVTPERLASSRCDSL